jgi:hypothetical protein
MPNSIYCGQLPIFYLVHFLVVYAMVLYIFNVYMFTYVVTRREVFMITGFIELLEVVSTRTSYNAVANPLTRLLCKAQDKFSISSPVVA